MPAGPQRLTAHGAAPSRGEKERNPDCGAEATPGHARSLAPQALGAHGSTTSVAIAAAWTVKTSREPVRNDGTSRSRHAGSSSSEDRQPALLGGACKAVIEREDRRCRYVLGGQQHAAVGHLQQCLGL
jgi:hypothetical protein